MFVGIGLRLALPTAAGIGFKPLGNEFNVVGIWLTRGDSRQELATRAMVGSGCGPFKCSTITLPNKQNYT